MDYDVVWERIKTSPLAFLLSESGERTRAKRDTNFMSAESPG
jgi:hypothetical protein